MVEIYKAPQVEVDSNRYEPTRIRVFLAGSIEMGKAEDWQTKVTQHLTNIYANTEVKLIVFNPRRDDWDSSWKQEIQNEKFFEQVKWELDRLENSDVILMVFDKNTKSPITLLELGLHARDNKLIVLCPNGYWRKGNVDIVCKINNIPVYEDFDEFMENAVRSINSVWSDKTSYYAEDN